MRPDSSLSERRVVAIRKGTPPIEMQEVFDLLEQLPQWRLETTGKGINQLVRFYEFADFNKALEFSKLINAMADSANHHPQQQIEENLLTMRWWTHSIKGLHLNDFIMAARSDDLYRNNC